jgi:hypothetical protein
MARDPMFRPDDSQELIEEIEEVKKRGYRVKRMTKWHFKIGEVNYYPGRGTITIDPDIRHPEKGREALLELLESRKHGKVIMMMPPRAS